VSNLDPSLAALVDAIAHQMAAEGIEKERQHPRDRTGGTPVEIASPHRIRRAVSDETALRRAIEAAIAGGAAPIRAELFPDGRILLFFDGAGPPGAVGAWREVLDASSAGKRSCKPRE
jgi:hypothetical protein